MALTQLGNPLITVKEARKLLGQDARTLTDRQVEDLIITLTGLSHLLLRQAGGSKKTVGGVS